MRCKLVFFFFFPLLFCLSIVAAAFFFSFFFLFFIFIVLFFSRFIRPLSFGIREALDRRRVAGAPLKNSQIQPSSLDERGTTWEPPDSRLSSLLAEYFACRFCTAANFFFLFVTYAARSCCCCCCCCYQEAPLLRSIASLASFARSVPRSRILLVLNLPGVSPTKKILKNHHRSRNNSTIADTRQKSNFLSNTILSNSTSSPSMRIL